MGEEVVEDEDQDQRDHHGAGHRGADLTRAALCVQPDAGGHQDHHEAEHLGLQHPVENILEVGVAPQRGKISRGLERDEGHALGDKGPAQPPDHVRHDAQHRHHEQDRRQPRQDEHAGGGNVHGLEGVDLLVDRSKK